MSERLTREQIEDAFPFIKASVEHTLPPKRYVEALVAMRDMALSSLTARDAGIEEVENLVKSRDPRLQGPCDYRLPCPNQSKICPCNERRKESEAILAAIRALKGPQSPADTGFVRVPVEGGTMDTAPGPMVKFDCWCVAPEHPNMTPIRFPDVEMRGDLSGFGWVGVSADGRGYWQYLDARDGGPYPPWKPVFWTPKPASPAQTGEQK